MAKRKRVSRVRGSVKKGRGIAGSVLGAVGSVINRAVDALPFELHLPGGYRYCGPGTRLRERLARGDKGINGLDEACKIHDIAYSRYKDTPSRAKADKELAERAWTRFKASDSSIGEKAAAWAVTTAMKAKSKFGGGRKRRAPKKGGGVRKTGGGGSKRGKGLYLRPYRIGGGVRKRRRVTKKKRQSR